ASSSRSASPRASSDAPGSRRGTQVLFCVPRAVFDGLAREAELCRKTWYVSDACGSGGIGVRTCSFPPSDMHLRTNRRARSGNSPAETPHLRSRVSPGAAAALALTLALPVASLAAAPEGAPSGDHVGQGAVRDGEPRVTATLMAERHGD